MSGTLPPKLQSHQNVHKCQDHTLCSHHTAEGQVHYCCNCRCGRIWRHHAQRKAVQRSAGTTPILPPGSAPQIPPAATLHPRQAATAVADSLPLLEWGTLMSALLLNPTHDSVRSLAVSLVKQLCLDTPHMTLRLLSRLAAMLPQAAAAGQYMCGTHNISYLVPV